MTIGIVLIIKRIWFLRHAHRTRGEVILMEERYPFGFFHSRDQPAIPYPLPKIRFTADNGMTYEFVDHSTSRFLPYRLGSSVPVVYDPKDPRKASINHGLLLWTRFVGLVVLGIVLLFFVFVVSITSTERKKESILAEKTPAAGQEWRDPVSGGDSDSDNNSSSLTQELLSVQPDLLAQQKNGLLQERPGIIDLYFVGFAASASLDVFMKEVIYAQQLFNDRFDTKGRSAILVNNTQTIDTLPIASPFNLDEVLKYIGNTINQEEDMVFLFLTGYGTKENSLAVDFDPYLLRDLKPADLKQILQNSGIKWKVIVVFACFSGGFIAPLEDSHTLIMTASNPEQRSFGCSHEAEFTYFGKAFFKHQLNLERTSFIKAFQEAKIQIYQWEEKWNVEHSDPQISFPDPITKKLEAFELQLTLQTE